MPLKHIDDITLQQLAQSENMIPEYESHLKECSRCRESLSFYKSMFPLLSEKLEGDFSPDFAINIINQTTKLEQRVRKLRSSFFFALILILSVIPFILFPDSLLQFKILGGSFNDFFRFIKSNIIHYNLTSWSILSVLVLVAVIQVYEFAMRHITRKKQYR